MRTAIITLLVVAVSVLSFTSCAEKADKIADKIADFKRIDTSPINYLSCLKYDTDFFAKLSFEDRVAMMTKKSIAIPPIKLTKRGDTFVRVFKKFTLVCIKGSCMIFSDDLLSRDLVENIIKGVDC